MTEPTAFSERPLSPFVTIYRWPVTMVMSIAHRISGGALYFGTVFLAVWLFAVAYGGGFFHIINVICSSFIGRTVLFLYTLALVHHFAGGIRHLFWDTRTALLEKHCASKVARATVFISVFLTLLIWVVVYRTL